MTKPLMFIGQTVVSTKMLRRQIRIQPNGKLNDQDTSTVTNFIKTSFPVEDYNYEYNIQINKVTDVSIINLVQESRDDFYVIYKIGFSSYISESFKTQNGLVDLPPKPEGLRISKEPRSYESVHVVWEDYSKTSDGFTGTVNNFLIIFSKLNAAMTTLTKSKTFYFFFIFDHLQI